MIKPRAAKPRGIQRGWREHAVNLAKAGDLLRSLGVIDEWGDPVDARICLQGRIIRVVSAIYDNGHRVTFRQSRDERDYELRMEMSL